MCCFLALRKVLLLMAILHMFIGLLYIYYAVALISTLATTKNDFAKGFLFMTYYCLFLPLGLVIFWGTHKKSRFLLKWSAVVFFLLQIYCMVIQLTFSFSISSWTVSKDQKVVEWNITTKIIFQSFLTISYLFTIFFYLRELEPDEDQWNVMAHRQVAYHPTQQQPIPIPNIQSHHDFMMKC